MSIRAGNVVQLSLVALFMGAFGAIIGTGLTTLVSAHGGDEDLVHACVRDVPAPSGPLSSLFSTLLRDGDVRIVDADEACKPGEVPVDWPGIGGGGITGYQLVTDTEIGAAANGVAVSGHVDCPEGKQALGGGGSTNNPAYVIGASYPVQFLDLPLQRWAVEFFNTGGEAETSRTAYVICANVPYP